MQNGKVQKQDARKWIKTDKNAPLERDWVFAGSQFYDDPITKKKRYAADDGDLITVANFSSAILDLPIESSANDADRSFLTNTELIPPLGTEVLSRFIHDRPRYCRNPLRPRHELNDRPRKSRFGLRSRRR